MWEISGYSQYICFCYAIFMGVVLGFIYDVFKFDRILFKRSMIFIFISDVLFWIISAFVIFSFCIVFSNGQVRGYIIFGSLIGFLIFKILFSRIFFWFLNPFKKITKSINLFYVLGMKNLNLFIFNIKNLIKKIVISKKIKNNENIQKNS